MLFCIDGKFVARFSLAAVELLPRRLIRSPSYMVSRTAAVQRKSVCSRRSKQHLVPKGGNKQAHCITI